MDYKLPDFLLVPLTSEERQRVREKINLEKQYYKMFPDTQLFGHIREGIGDERYYRILEDCIQQGKPADELYPEVTDLDPEDEI